MVRPRCLSVRMIASISAVSIGGNPAAGTPAVSIGVVRPAQRAQHPDHDAVGLMLVPIIMEAPNYQAMVINQPALGLVNWVVLDPSRLVELIVEGWLVHDDEVGARGDRLLDHLVACQKCYND